MNAVYLEMVKLGRKWSQEQKKHPEAVSYVLLGERPQNQLFETWFKYQLSEESRTDDMYLIYYQAFENPHTYSASLLEELKYVYQQWQKEATEAPGWLTEDDTVNKGPAFYIDALLKFLEQYPGLKENKIFIHLAPTAIADRNAYETWITECGKHIESRKAEGFIKLVFTDHGSYRTVKNFYKPHFWEFPIDVSSLMEKTAEGSNKRKGAKENNFQQLILKAGNFLGKQQYSEADMMLNQAIKVAVENKYNQGTVMARMLKAQNYQAQAKHDEAAEIYEQALKDAKGDTDILVQVYFSYGAFLISRKEKKKALEVFEEIEKIAREKRHIVLQIEAGRLIGQLNDSRLFSGKTVSCYEKCIELGRQLPRNELAETSLPYIASLLMKKYGEGTDKGEALDETMTDLFGKEWRKLVIIPDLKKSKSFE
jgi:tetratricopeptide (TPR) repeat protein